MFRIKQFLAWTLEIPPKVLFLCTALHLLNVYFYATFELSLIKVSSVLFNPTINASKPHW